MKLPKAFPATKSEEPSRKLEDSNSNTIHNLGFGDLGKANKSETITLGRRHSERKHERSRHKKGFSNDRHVFFKCGPLTGRPQVSFPQHLDL